MSRKLKELMVEEMADRFSELKQRGCVLVGFRGLSGQESAEVRGLLLQAGARMTVVRNRLLAIALDRVGVPELAGALEGPTAVITAEEPVAAARAAERAAEDFPHLDVVCGYGEGRFLDRAGVKKLASLPDRTTLLGQTLTCMCLPAQRFANCLSGAMQRLASVLRQVRDKKQEQAGGQ